MRDRFDQPPRRVRRQLRVGIERDDVGRSAAASARCRERWFLSCARQQAVRTSAQRNAFSSSSLPRLRSRPIQLLLALGPHPLPVKEQETIAPFACRGRIGSRGYAYSDRRSRRARVCSSSASSGADLFGRIREIGKQAVENVVIPIAEISELRASRFPPGPRPRLVSIIGTTTSVALAAGMPLRKSSFGSGSGGSSEITSAFTICTRQFAERK